MIWKLLIANNLKIFDEILVMQYVTSNFYCLKLIFNKMFLFIQ